MSARLESLAASLSPGAVALSEGQLDAHAHDMSQLAPWSRPLAVVRASGVSDIVETLAFARSEKLSVVPQGARTGLCGGANTSTGAIALSLERMSAIRSIDVDERIAVVEPGVINKDLSDAVLSHGLFYPPDPGSWAISTIGGNVATNAGGLCCVKYGVTADHVRSLEVVLASGDVIRTGTATRKGVVGYDLTRLFVGSEGTLGIISEVTVDLVPAPPDPVTVAAFFPSMAAATAAVLDVQRSGLVPSLLELLDGASLRAVDDVYGLGVPRDADAMLIAQSDDGDVLQARFIDRVVPLFEGHGAIEVAVGEDRQESDVLMTARRNVYFAGEQFGAMITDDVCVPLVGLARFIDGARDIAAEAGLRLTTVGHAGDGNVHTSVFHERGNDAEARRAHEVSVAVMRFGLSLGGTVSGEHGIGALKTELLAEELGPTVVGLHHGIKRALDPDGLLNPGKVFAGSGRSTIGS